MKITPRFVKRGPNTGHYRFPESVPVIGADGYTLTPYAALPMSSNNQGEVSVRVVIDGEGLPALYVEFTREELARMASFSEECAEGKPLLYAMQWRSFKVDGHAVKVRGWVAPSGQWFNDRDLPPQCETCSLSLKSSNAVLFMAENGVRRMTVDGAEILAN